MQPENTEVQKILKDRFDQLPPPVQQAILSANVEKHLQELAGKHKLHLDQWISLENEVMMALLGIQSVEDLGKNIASEAEIPRELGEQIADDAFELVFEPIRQRLEQELGNPNATNEVAPAEAARQAAITQAHKDEEGATKSAPRSVQNVSSAKRSAIVSDPYREPVQ